jgi:hypothetical protein
MRQDFMLEPMRRLRPAVDCTEGPKPRLSAEQLAQFAQIVEARPDREVDGVARWRRIVLNRVIAESFSVDFDERYVGKPLQKLGFSQDAILHAACAAWRNLIAEPKTIAARNARLGSRRSGAMTLGITRSRRESAVSAVNPKGRASLSSASIS